MRLLCLPLLLAACAKQATPENAATAAPAAPAEEITLTFGMQPGWEGSYTTVVETRKMKQGSTQVETIRVRGPMAIRALDDAHVGFGSSVSTVDVTRTLDGAAQEIPPQEAALFNILLRMPNTARIAPSGAWAGLVDAERVLGEFSASLNDYVTELRATLPSEEARAMFDSFASVAGLSRMQQQMQQQMAADWDRQTAQWAGAAFEPATEYVVEFEQAHPQTGTPMPWSVRFEVNPGEPCPASDSARECARIDAVTQPDPEAFRAEAEAVTRAMLAQVGQGDVSLAEASMTLVATYVVEPTTMRPWSQVEVTTTRMVPTETAIPTTEILKRSETTYDWTR